MYDSSSLEVSGGFPANYAETDQEDFSDWARVGSMIVGGSPGRWRQNVRKIMRIVLTILMYAGVVVFLIPYFRGTITTSAIFLIFGAGFAVLCGLLRCYLTEGDCGRVHHTGRDW